MRLSSALWSAGIALQILVKSRVHFPVPGERFEGKYLIDKVLGSGGFARVYLATEVGLQRPVALKVLMPPNVETKTNTQRDQWLNSTISRFEREAQVLSKLRCAHTVIVYAFGRTEDGLMYMALEYVEGLNLTELTIEQGALSPARVVKILRQILLSLQEAHSQGMLHRDIKPANIMVFEHMGVPDNVKLLDFGIAKAVGEMKAKSEDLTGDGTLIGTPRYMSPEQIQGEPEVGPPSDIYSLGLVIYELLMGERAITVENSLQVIGQQLSPAPFALPLSARIPSRLKAVVNRMLEKDLSKRFKTVDQILTVINDPNILIEDLDALPDITLSLEPAPLQDTGSFSSKKQVAAIGALVLVIVVLIGINALRTSGGDGKGHAAALPGVEVAPVKTQEPPAEEPVGNTAAQLVDPLAEVDLVPVDPEPKVIEIEEAVEETKVADKAKVAQKPKKDRKTTTRVVDKKADPRPDSLFPLIE